MMCCSLEKGVCMKCVIGITTTQMSSQQVVNIDVPCKQEKLELLIT